MLALAAGIWVCEGLQRGISREKTGKGTRKRGLWGRLRTFLQCWFPVLAGMEWMIVCLVLNGSGIMDYKKNLWVTILWYVASMWTLTLTEEEGSEEWRS